MSNKKLYKQLLALRLAYHGIGAWIEQTEESSKCKGCVESMDSQKKRIAGKLMRKISEKCEAIQPKLGIDGGELAELVVKKISENSALPREIGNHFFPPNKGKEQIGDEDISWLLKLAREEKII